MTPVAEVIFFASTAICSASSLVGDITIALILSALARWRRRGRSANVGSFSMIRCMTGTRKPRVFPVPVFACAILRLDQLGLGNGETKLHVNAIQCLVNRA